ncbi:integral membrane protein [Moelleriella libera RCEF 2490]|uniref:Integral membrane protein n=1 Tax=Moelleriella libera RCEF 2490 TaxID=1081109 RepID=A0A168D645_9HYPO|nr:integral membrane protein [Moelleriella libera RCEF 2490]
MVWVANATPEVDAQSQWVTIMVVCLVLSVLSIATVCARLWVRGKGRGLGGDDYMSALSMVFALAYSILCIVQTKFGLGLPLKLRPKEDVGPYSRVNFAGRPIYQLGISFFKIALLISYLRLLQGTDHKIYRMVVWGTMIAVFLAHLGCTLSLIFACTPVEKSWKPWVTGSCLQPGPSFTGYAVVTIVSDVVVAILPIPVLLRLNVRLEKKLGLIGIFMLGLFTTICSILRYLQIDRIQYGDGNSTMLILWGVIEFNVGNMVSSLPFLAPVCMRKAKDYRSKYSGGYRGENSGQGQSRGLRNVERYKLSDVSNDKSAFASTDKSVSQENMPDNGTIIKSVTYSVRVDDGISSARGNPRPKEHV